MWLDGKREEGEGVSNMAGCLLCCEEQKEVQTADSAPESLRSKMMGEATAGSLNPAELERL